MGYPVYTGKPLNYSYDDRFHRAIAEGLAEEVGASCEPYDNPQHHIRAYGHWYQWSWNDPLREPVIVGLTEGQLKVGRELSDSDCGIIDVFVHSTYELCQPDLIEALKKRFSEGSWSWASHGKDVDNA